MTVGAGAGEYSLYAEIANAIKVDALKSDVWKHALSDKGDVNN